ncbi:hypothetical protein [Flaviflexus huanghaiensis]|uniref:hypothetical protein n=1 Tax=Flaviflexus huanghaiensis TaxID=1111473 RepID=UPI0019D54EB7|nr:hypothetical protein [Flaviflexus huanghaiensis]
MKLKQMAGIAAGSLLLAGCSSVLGDGSDEDSDGGGAAVTTPTVHLISGDSPADASIKASQQFFESSPGAIVTGEEFQLEAASLSAAYSVPTLIEGEGVADELERLGASWVIAVGTDLGDAGGDGGLPDDVDVVGAVPALGTETDSGEQSEADPAITVVEPEGEGLDALLALNEGEALIAAESRDVQFSQDIDPLEAVTVLTDGSHLAAVGTARAAGSQIVFSPADPRSSREAIEAASSADVALGIFAGELPDFEWQVATAATGVELPGGTQLVFGGKRYIALYGSPITPALGVLGEQDVPATVERAEQMAEPYRALTEDTVLAAQEIIVTVSAGQPGDDGNYSNEGAIEWFVPLIEAAGEAGQYVVLDFQPGRSDFLSQIQLYEELLAYPHVGIALDPEWRLGPDEMPLTRIGHVEIAEVNEVVNYLADYVQENELPQKLIILHQFQLQMIRDRDQLDQSRPEVALLIHADGQGSQPAKNDTWRALHQDAPEGIAWGWKNFFDEDLPMLTPEGTYEVEPMPEFVSYQ